MLILIPPSRQRISILIFATVALACANMSPMSGRLRFGFVLVGACFGLACGHDAQLRRERLASPDCQRAGADPETCGGLGAAKAQRESGPGAGDVALEVPSASCPSPPRRR